MRARVVAVCAAVALLIPAPAPAQQTGVTNLSYGRGRVVLKNLNQYEANDIRFSEAQLSFKDSKTGRPFTVPLSDVEWVSRKKNMALTGGLAGAGLAALVGLLAWAQVESDPYLEPTENAGTIVLGMTAGGAAIGALIGAAVSTEKTVYEKGRFRVGLIVPPARPSGKGTSACLAQVHMTF